MTINFTPGGRIFFVVLIIPMLFVFIFILLPHFSVLLLFFYKKKACYFALGCTNGVCRSRGILIVLGVL